MLPHDKHGRPVPWFVAWIGGKPDFRITAYGAAAVAWGQKSCWVCGCAFQRQEPRSFVVGPMCAVNRISSEPPSHYECADFSARACPFLTNPTMIRRERHLPPGVGDPPGTFIRRNPGITLVWTTKYNQPGLTPTRDGGYLFRIGEPVTVEWYAEGRPATRDEVLASIEAGLPALMEACDGNAAALVKLADAHLAALALVPA